jgi:predicted lipid-binding transport protein (Tim44 family)
MAAVMPATPTTPTTATTMPSYQVSGAGAAPRHAAAAGSSIGAFFGVLAAVLVLTVLSCVFGRVCAAQAEGPDESYDCTRMARWRRRRAARRRAALAAEGPPPPPPLLPEP